MEPVACGHCGKCDDEANMFVCSGCFEIHFCSVDHFNQHPHSKIEDAQHFDPGEEIGPNIRRAFSTGKYEKGLVALKDAFILHMASGDPIETSNIIGLLLNPVSRKRESAFRDRWNMYFIALQAAVTDEVTSLDEAMKIITSPSVYLVDLWAEENRLSLRQTRKAINSAWFYFNRLLLNYRFRDQNGKLSSDMQISQVIPRVAKVLGGGKSDL